MVSGMILSGSALIDFIACREFIPLLSSYFSLTSFFPFIVRCILSFPRSILDMATHYLASWVNTLKYSDLPQEVIAAAVRSFYNWAGCAIGGSNHPATTIAVRSCVIPYLSSPLTQIPARCAKTIFWLSGSFSPWP
jgi:hypothetical protein